MRVFLEKPPTSDSNRQLSHKDKSSYIMIIAEEIEWAETLQLELTRKGCQVSVIHNGLRGLFAVRQIEPDLVIISWSPLGLSGLEICYRLKSSGIYIPIILLTQSNSVTQRIDGFRAGANDCISPSFSIEELFARIQANLAPIVIKKIKPQYYDALICNLIEKLERFFEETGLYVLRLKSLICWNI